VRPVFAFALVLTVASFPTFASRVEAAPPVRAPIVVTLVIDQLGAWIADERWPLLPATGGFARLRREGTAATIVYDYAVSDTAPGHATLLTGASPRTSGIFANEIIDEETRKKISILRDTATHVVASDGTRDLPSSSLAVLKVPTLADAFRRAHPHGTIVSLSLKDRAALFGGGRAPTAVIWFDAGLGRFVTGSAFAATFPAWALTHAGPDVLRAQMDKVWVPLDEKFVAAHALTPDAQDGEGNLDGIGLTFPHAMARASDPAHAFRATPFADELLLALAVDAVDAAPPAEPMLLALSLSSNDYIGHVFGPDSWEAWDELERLDAALARFFTALDERAGPNGWSLLLAADHGVTTMPEAAARARPWCKSERLAPDRWQRPCGPAGRVLSDELADQLRVVAKRAIGDGDWIAGVADPYVYLTDAARALDPDRRRRLHDALAVAIAAMPGVASVVDVRKPPARCPPGDGVAATICRGMVPGAPGELYIALQPGWFFDPDYVIGKGTSHGSPYVYDRSVPLVVRAPGRVATGRTIAAPLPASSFAATAAHLLDIAAPAAARGGRDLAR
jgi:hypothetical protein